MLPDKIWGEKRRMTQAQFRAYIEAIFGDMPMEDFVSSEIFSHMNRVQLENEGRAWTFARENAQDSFQMTVRAMAKTMFAIGYDAGREQAQVDSLFGSSSMQSEDDGANEEGNNSLVV